MSAELENDSTLIRHGRAAVTVNDMISFVSVLEERPICTLLGELPALAGLSENKFRLATKILRRRFRAETDVDQAQLRCIAEEIAASSTSAAVAGRIRWMFRRERD